MTHSQKIGLALLGIVALFVALALVDPTTRFWPFHCPFKLITGLQCPGCGGQRALHALLKGNLREAISYNLFLVYAGPYVLALIIAHLLPEGHAKATSLKWLEHPAVIWFYIIAFMVWLIVRNILHI